MSRILQPHQIRRAQKPVSRVTVRSITVQRRASAQIPESQQLNYEDIFSKFGAIPGVGQILQPAYSVPDMFRLRETSNMLGQCIEAYVTNLVLTGWEIDTTIRGREVNADEQFELQSFLDNPNTEQSLVGLMADIIRERETTGFSFMEVVRDAAGLPAILRHASALNTRLTRRHPTSVQVSYQIMRGRRITTVAEMRRFRKFVQIVGAETRFFKEFGDPRKMDARTGAFEGEPTYAPGMDASEILMFKINNSTNPYGAPRWISQTPSIVGSREAEEVNVRYFRDNTVPPMMLLVGNGRLTKGSYSQLQQQLNQESIGADRQHKILLVEAVGESESLDGKSSPISLTVERLADSRQSDALFGDYDKSNMEKVRSSFRLPPVLVGMSQDVNFATATTSVLVAEAQVFAPERSQNDDILNRMLVNGPYGLGLRSVKLVSRPPSITSPDQVIKTLTALNVMGAVTPRMAQLVANQLLQTELPAYPKPGEDGYEEWMDQPMPITIRDAAAHSQAEQASKPGEVKATEGSGDTSPQQPKNGQQ